MNVSTDLDLAFASQLKRHREEARLSQAGIAERMQDLGHDWHQSTVYKCEAGSRKISIGEAASLSDIFKIPLDALLRGARAEGASTRDLVFGLATTTDLLLEMHERASQWSAEMANLRAAAAAFDELGLTLDDVTGQRDIAESATQRYARYMALTFPRDFLAQYEAALPVIAPVFEDLGFGEAPTSG